jgi:DNA-binding CsgD family transcriptional regulator
MIFGLSPGQMALAARIASGESLTDAAKTQQISINTARTHLKRIYDKTGVNSQTALVRLLLSVG